MGDKETEFGRVESVDIILPLEFSEDREAWLNAIEKKLGIPRREITEFRLLKHSIDARQRRIKVQLRIEVAIDGSFPPSEKSPLSSLPSLAASCKTVIIVGCGPAGMFAALQCIKLGLRPLILERGKDASARRFDLAPILRKGTVIEDSNYCFGEGGAGTFSDGKLYTRATKRGPVRVVYETLVAHGAPERILIDAHPHIGSNLLPNVVKAMRETIISAGGEVRFESKVVDLIQNGDSLCGVVLADGAQLIGDAVILATGHSARDIYQLLAEKNILLEQKPFAVGVRIEHPQDYIDSIQYHKDPGERRNKLLPAASYRVATKIDNRGVHSFCMCPGGFIVPAATENDEVVVNGMSLSRRDSPFANSGLVVTVEPEDTVSFAPKYGVLAGMAFQRELETAAKNAGGGGQIAPAQRASDFLKGTLSETLPETSYYPGIKSARLDELLPPWIVSRLRQGLELFSKQMPNFAGEEVNLIGFETRTSSPVRIPRDRESLEHPEVKGLFPCGEGAGFAGGIVSAALDGLKCAEAVAKKVKSY